MPTQIVKPCPCGAPHTANDLQLDCYDQAKWGRVGCKCGDWWVEFRNAYARGDARLEPAIDMWNLARREES
jgi:hypothetical protein